MSLCANNMVKPKPLTSIINKQVENGFYCVNRIKIICVSKN